MPRKDGRAATSGRKTTKNRPRQGKRRTGKAPQGGRAGRKSGGTSLWTDLRNPPKTLNTAAARRSNWAHFILIDHAFVRSFWTNMAEVAPGVWRANQPSPRRIERWGRRGIRAILNLRGAGQQSHMLFEREACARAGIALHNVAMSARKLPPAKTLLHLIATFRSIEKPFVMHCKSGSDRSGLAAALYRLAILGEPLSEARRELSWRFLHFRNSETGIIDALLDQYAEDTADTAQGIEDWIATRYDPATITARWERSTGRRAGAD